MQKSSRLDVLNEIKKIAIESTSLHLTDRHNVMIESRIQRRIYELGLSSMEDYLEFIRKNKSTEVKNLVSILTTHHTYFFREFSHFELLSDRIIPELLLPATAHKEKLIRIWSAACSTGQEAYSLAMYLHYLQNSKGLKFNYEIIATDIDEKSVKFAQNGVYLWSDLKEVPMKFISNLWVRGSGEISNYVKVKDVIKDKIKFYSRNLFDIKNKEFGIFDVIFCRNVFIYFDKHKIIELSKKFLDHLNKNGYLFLGISESISDLTLPIKAVGTSVYTFDSNKNFEQKTKESTKRLIKVLCVDDSPTILALLKKILTKDHGFEVVDMALNGLECSDKLTKNKVDVITLDIHMPSQDGVEYLRKNFNKIHPPVIMISSVSRENSDLALSAIRLGASDFVEKPSMSNLEEKSEEIRMKIKSIVLSKEQKEKNIDKAPIFEVSNLDIPDCDKKIRIICANYFDMFKISSLLNSLKGNQPPVVLSIEGASSFDKNFSENLAIELRKSVSLVEKMQGCLKANTISVFDINDRFKELVSLYAQDEISVLVLGQLSQKTSQTLLGFSWSQLVLEDLGDGKGSKLLNDKADDILPVTSFEYVSTRFLCKK